MPRPSSHISRSKAPISGLEALFISSHRFGFNGQERTDEIAGIGNHTTALFWEYDTRLGRRWNLDPVVKEYESPYLTFTGNPITQIDPLGNSATRYEDEDGNEIRTTKDGQDDKKVVVTKDQRKKFDIWVRIGEENGVINNPEYNNKLSNEVESGLNKWSSFTESSFNFSVGIQIGTEIKLGTGNIALDFNLASFDIVNLNTTFIDNIESTESYTCFDDNTVKIKHGISAAQGVGFSSERSRTGFKEGGMLDDGQTAFSYSGFGIEYKKTYQKNVITETIVLKQLAEGSLIFRLGGSVSTGFIRRTLNK